MRNISLLFLFLLILSAGCRHDPDIPAEPVYFDTQILPLIRSNCAKSGCHDGSGDKMSLTNYDEIMSVVTSGKPQKSDLYKTITAKGSWISQLMPPNGPLPIQDIRNIYVWILQGAKNNVEPISGCDSVNITFSGTIAPILSTYCNGCHSGGNPSAGIDLTDYSGVVAVSDTTNHNQNNRFLISIEQTGQYPMPVGGKLSDCNIAQIKKWIHDGQQNN